ncbi:MAG: transposase [Ignavibacteriaceae bacterium]
MNPPRFFQEDTYHHLYNRGVNRGEIFFDLNDYLFFQRRLLKYKLKYSIKVLCYCLMPNHFHLFVWQTLKDKPLSKFISDLINSYTKSINKKYKRSGVLFESETKNKIIYDEKTYPALVKYILMNPVRANLCRTSEEYEFSSAKEIMKLTPYNITDEIISNYFESIEKFREYMVGEV